MTLKFDLISDIHCDQNGMFSDNQWFDWERTKQSDILIIAGDISNNPNMSLNILEEAGEFYKKVLWISGNHDAYCLGTKQMTISELDQFFKDAETENVINLQYTPVVIDNTLFIGAMGFYDFKSCLGVPQHVQKEMWRKHLNDATQMTFDIQPETYAILHAEYLANLVTMANGDDTIENIVVVTHTVPTAKGVVPPDHKWYPLNGGFHNTEMSKVVDADINKKIKYFCSGHTHFPYFFQEDHVTYVCNPRGYKFERKNAPGGDRTQIMLSI